MTSTSTQEASSILELFRQQIDEGLAFLGARSVHDLDPSYVQVPDSWATKRPATA